MQWDIAPEILSALIIVIILGNSRRGNAVPTIRDKTFRFCLYYTIFCTALNVLSIQTVYHAASIPLWVNMVVNTAYFALYPPLPLIFILYILLYVFEFTPQEHRSRLRIVIALLFLSMTFYLVIVALNIFTGWIFHFDESHQYFRGPLNRLSLVVASFQITVTLVIIWMERKYLDRSFFEVILWLPFLSLGIITVQFLYPNIVLTGTAITLAILSVYLNFQTRRITIDFLTQYPNRGSFITSINQIRRYNRKALILVVSLDDFKAVNDTYGQSRGDLLLKSIAENLHELIPQGQVFRYGGDEFSVIVNAKYGENLANSILQRFHSSWHIGGLSIQLRASIATLHLPFRPDMDSDPITLLDHAIRTAKNRGKGQVVHCDATLLSTIKRKNQLAERLMVAIEEKTLYIELQPIFSIESGEPVKAEALLRMNDPQVGVVSPSEFIPLAEELGIIGDLGRWVLDQVCALLDAARAKGQRTYPISVNFSGIQFSHTHVVHEILEIIQRYHIPPHIINIELTESTFISSDYNEALSVMRPLIDRGINFHLDDFGTGYSNLAYLVNLPFDCIKLDKSLLWNLSENGRAHRLIESVIKAVRDMGFHVIVEGVENKEQLDYLHSIECDMVQGYYLSPPKAPEEIFSSLQSRSKL